MSIADKLKRLIQVKSDLKKELLAKGLISDSTPFSEYPAAIQKLSEPLSTLTIIFNNKYFYNTTMGSRTYYATSSKYKSYLLVNGVDYFDQAYGKLIVKDNTQPTVYVTAKVPKGQVTIKAYMLIGAKATTPTGRRGYDSSTLNTQNPDVQTIDVTSEKASVTFTSKYQQDYLTY